MRKLLSCLLLLVPFFGLGQKYAFQTYSTEDGLPQTQVRAFCEDDNGYLWVGTLGGLAKFNGKEFTTFSPKEGLLNNRIQSLFFDKGILWIGHDGGVSTWENNKFRHFKLSGEHKSREVSKIVRFNGRIVACVNRGGGLFEVENNRLERIPLPSFEDVNKREINSIRSAVVSDGCLYLATRAGILRTKDLKKFVFEPEIEQSSYVGIEANDQEIYFVSHKNGIYHKEIESGIITHIPKDDVLNNLRGSELDRKGVLWVYKNGGLLKISKDKVIRLVNRVSGLPVNNAVECIYNDYSGNIWIGSNGKGMFRFPGEQFKYYDRSNGFLSDLFLCGFEDKQGSMYLGTLDEGIVKRSKDGKVTVLDVGLSKTVWAAQAYVDNKHWFGTGNGMVSLDADDNVELYNTEDGLPGFKISAFYKVGPREMYIGGHAGVSHYKNGVIRRLHHPDSIEVGTVRDFIMVDGVLVFATNLGLFQYKDGIISLFRNVESVSYCIAKDIHENIWFGTEEGLFRIRNGKTEQLELRNNPASNFINFLNVIDERLYVGSNNGLFIISNLDSEVPNIKRYGLDDGIVDLETNLNSSFFDNSGNYWFGTASGLVCFDGRAELANGGSPKIQIKSILLNYEEFNYSSYSDELDRNGFPKKLNLPYSKNNLIFELDGISMSNHSGLSYQFLLEGLNDNWSPLSTNATINFTTLPAGDYTLRMRAVDIDGLESEEIVIPFIIQPAFYRTWWFISLCCLLYTSPSPRDDR